ncbi:MAG: homoserine dehydrogenase [Chloroflexi bacterium]|nr:homoserine dehydrogenase [Chloroflexota bacterium]
MAALRQVPLILLGAGHVGRAFLRQWIRVRAHLAERYTLDLQPVVVADSSGALADWQGFSAETIQAVIDTKAGGQSLASLANAVAGLSAADLLEQARANGVGDAIVVDVTAGEHMTPVLRQALQQGYSLVLANKRPLAGPWPDAQAFFRSPQVCFEATVGAGLPVINTLRYLVDTGDVVQRIEGALSGTLGYLCSRLEDGEAFSVVVGAAKAHGYTEPDPREDLSGIDVARKVLILARMAGWPLEMGDLKVDPLYPAQMAEISVAEFMNELPRLDADFAAYMGALAGVPRYMAEVGPQGGIVSLRMVGERLAAQLRGTRNLVSFWTEQYTEMPLSIGGPGGGGRVAASAVLNDCLRLAQVNPCA